MHVRACKCDCDFGEYIYRCAAERMPRGAYRKLLELNSKNKIKQLCIVLIVIGW
jgi:hypothetical protein